jgi:hypothetical protein
MPKGGGGAGSNYFSHAMHTNGGKFAISFLLGVGLASLFRKVCTDRSCMVFRPPPFDEVVKNTYSHDGKCYTFKDKPVACTGYQRVIDFE